MHTLQKYRISLQKDARDSELILNSSKITFDDANQLSIRKAAGNISTLAQQLMTRNLNYVGHDTKADLQDFQSDKKDEEFAKILTRHLNQKPCNVVRTSEFFSVLICFLVFFMLEKF